MAEALGKVQDIIQVTRNGLRFSVDESLSEAENAGHATYTLPELLAYLDPWIEPGPDSYPRITWKGGVQGRRAGSQGAWPETGPKRFASLFTATSKMNCPSFSLPAGSVRQGGSCLAASVGCPLTPCTGRPHICSNCYALKGNYVNLEPIFAQVARQAIIRKNLRQWRAKDPTGQSLAGTLVDAIRACARARMSSRSIYEIGLMGPGGLVTGPRSTSTTLFNQTWRPSGPRAPRTSTEALVKLGAKVGDVAGFFRIHDSGDFSPSTNFDENIAYLQAWVEVAKALPRVVFWAPTRLWVFPNYQKAFSQLVSSVPNLVIRPSAIHVGDPAPVVPGLGAGTTVHTTRHPVDTDERGRAIFTCPVSLTHGGSCMSTGCRLCWLDSETPVSYGAH